MALLPALTGCVKECPEHAPEATTVIHGKVVTFREDSLAWDGMLEVTLWKSTSKITSGWVVDSKLIGPPYAYRFTSTVTDCLDEDFLVGVATDVPRHSSYYQGDSDPVPQGTSAERTISLMPRTCIGYHLINEDPLPGDFISIPSIGGGAIKRYGAVNETVYDCSYWNGETPITYLVYSNEVDTRYYDTIYLSPFDTTYHTIIY